MFEAKKQELTYTEVPSKKSGASFELPDGRWVNMPEGAYSLLPQAFSIFFSEWGRAIRSGGNQKRKTKNK